MQDAMLLMAVNYFTSVLRSALTLANWPGPPLVGFGVVK